MKTNILKIAVAAFTLIGSVPIASAQNITVANAKQLVSEVTGSKLLNDATSSIMGVFDSSKWHDGAGHVKPGDMVDFDPTDPKSWATVISPQTHSKFHMTVTNPQFYAKFMTPGYYVKFMQPKTWLSYMDTDTYQPLLEVVSDPKTFSYWMQPGAYMHGLNPKAYLQMIDPEAYKKLTSKVAEGYGAETTNTAANMLNPFSWMKKFADASISIPSTEITKTQ
ncbi:MAG: hypothetical protein GY761_20800 [Hyphomicrobiales bacterium]|nr:hypothetical protein [Hyphomicrobiales bacterium]